MQWVESKQAERKIGRIEGPQPKNGETWVPKYTTMDALFAEYGQHDTSYDALADTLIADPDAMAALTQATVADIEPDY